MITEPAEGPFHRAAFHGEGVIQCLHIGRRFRQPAAQQTLHDDHGDPFFPGQTQAFRPRLVVDVHEIILDLRHVPVIVVEYVFKLLIGSVEGKALVADLAGPLHVFKELRRADGFESLPLFPVDAVHQIEVDVIRLQLLQLALQQRLHLRPVVNMLQRHLGGDGDPVAVTAAQGLAQNDLRSLVQVHKGGVQIGHAPVDSLTDE